MRLLGESGPRLLGRVSPSSGNDVWDKFSLRAENGEYYLTSSDGESLTSTSDVYLKATKVFPQLSDVAMHFPWFRLLKPHIIYQVDEEGKRHSWVEMKSTIMTDKIDAYIQLECG
ncbi:hypothetical protein QUB56_09975 [Microcoleus sp. AR_TQ3_B6]|uniref:hypothetical protein n=1 Tax=Microcoleus sp. AR_TQ3_B6 TaxID=3055284 RepID=UPI002FD6EA9E